MGEDDEKPSARLVDQRVRNEIIITLEFISSFEDQAQLAESIPTMNVRNEVINGYFDNMVEEIFPEGYGPPVYSTEETAALAEFNAVINDVIAETPKNLPPIDQCFENAQWIRLRDAAKVTLDVFAERGPVSHVVEIEG